MNDFEVKHWVFNRHNDKLMLRQIDLPRGQDGCFEQSPAEAIIIACKNYKRFGQQYRLSIAIKFNKTHYSKK